MVLKIFSFAFSNILWHNICIHLDIYSLIFFLCTISIIFFQKGTTLLIFLMYQLMNLSYKLLHVIEYKLFSIMFRTIGKWYYRFESSKVWNILWTVELYRKNKVFLFDRYLILWAHALYLERKSILFLFDNFFSYAKSNSLRDTLE